MRHAEIAMTYQGVDITSNISGDLLSIEYDENASGDADSLSIELDNKSLKWMNKWFPQGGDSARASITSYDWNLPGEVLKLDTGNMTVDDPQFNGMPHAMTLKALSTPAAAGWNDEPGHYTWASISMRQLGAYVAGKYGLSYTYDVPYDFTIKALKREDQTDADLLASTAQKYNIKVKIYSNRLVLYDMATYEARKPVKTLTLGASNIIGYSLSAPTVGTGYNAAVETYSLPDKEGKNLTYTFRIASGGKTLQINESVDDTAQAEMAAKAKLREANEKQYSGTLTMSLDLKLSAACNVQLAGFGKFTGIYFIDTCRHSIGKNDGQTEITIHKKLTGGY